MQDVLNNYNATVFAYGATGSGKTHTMVGTSSNPGIMVRALNDIFLAAKKLPDDTEFTVSLLRGKKKYFFNHFFPFLVFLQNLNADSVLFLPTICIRLYSKYIKVCLIFTINLSLYFIDKFYFCIQITQHCFLSNLSKIKLHDNDDYFEKHYIRKRGDSLHLKKIIRIF